MFFNNVYAFLAYLSLIIGIIIFALRLHNTKELLNEVYENRLDTNELLRAQKHEYERKYTEIQNKYFELQKKVDGMDLRPTPYVTVSSTRYVLTIYSKIVQLIVVPELPNPKAPRIQQYTHTYTAFMLISEYMATIKYISSNPERICPTAVIYAHDEDTQRLGWVKFKAITSNEGLTVHQIWSDGYFAYMNSPIADLAPPKITCIPPKELEVTCPTNFLVLILTSYQYLGIVDELEDELQEAIPNTEDS